MGRRIYCVGCEEFVNATLTDGKEIYPHRKDLAKLPFWKCRTCGNYVGCHHKTRNRTRPLGVIPTPELRTARQELHNILDAIWQFGEFSRSDVYGILSQKLGYEFHVGQVTSFQTIEEVKKLIKEIDWTHEIYEELRDQDCYEEEWFYDWRDL